VATEIEEMQYAIDQQPKNVKFMQIFSKEHIKRTAIVACANFFQQVTGQSFSSQYGTLFVKSLKTLNAFSVNMGNNAINIGGILVCLALNDRIGRR
jgi:SP family sugar:H+ symporter-like MFS transporter